VRVKLLVAAFALATTLGAASVQAQQDSNVEVVETASEAARRMTVPISIDGKGPFRFLLDTGAQATVLSRELADQLELFNRRPALLVGMASSLAVESTSVTGVALGRRTFDLQTTALVDRANLWGADGIMGLDLLQNQRVLFDFKDNEIHVADAQAGVGNRGFEIVVRARRKLGQLIITDARIDGIDVAVILDTGSQGSTGNLALFDRLTRARRLGEGTLVDVNGVALTGQMLVARRLAFEEAHITELPILFTESPTFRALNLTERPALILGMNQLRLFDRVVMDFRRQQVLFDLPSEDSYATREMLLGG
jgi:hypothetical protein